MRPKDSDRAREIGARITEARNAAGMKQRELAELLGVSERSIQAYEQGETIPWRFGHDLERVFNRSMGWFWYGRDEISSNAEDLLQLVLTEVRSIRAELAALKSEVERLAADQFIPTLGTKGRKRR